MIRIYDSINLKYLQEYKTKEDFILSGDYKQQETNALLGTLQSKKPVQDLAEIYGLQLK